MTSAALLQRAAELVVLFGLDDADTTEQQLYASAADGDAIMVTWTPRCDRDGAPRVELVVARRTASLSARVSAVAVALHADDARRVHELHGRIIDLAERIEALR